MVGAELAVRALRAGWETVALSRRELDITDPVALRRALEGRCQAVINAAAYTNVDGAEAEPELAQRVNAEAVARMADLCAERGIALVHLSSDYVFDGEARRPYRPDDPAAPLGAYGRSKWEGEVAVRSLCPRHLIVRTAWVFAPHGRNFLRTIASRAREQEELRVVDDQRGSPTLAGDLADAVLEAARQAVTGDARWGTYHFCNAGETSWYGFARAIVEGLARRGPIACRRVVPIPSAEYPTAARRPSYSVLDTSGWVTTFGRTPRPWEEALREALCLLH
jgi:dTDP-4-dehydrorhamnose reductase